MRSTSTRSWFPSCAREAGPYAARMAYCPYPYPPYAPRWPNTASRSTCCPCKASSSRPQARPSWLRRARRTNCLPLSASPRRAWELASATTREQAASCAPTSLRQTHRSAATCKTTPRLARSGSSSATWTTARAKRSAIAWKRCSQRAQRRLTSSPSSQRKTAPRGRFKSSATRGGVSAARIFSS